MPSSKGVSAGPMITAFLVWCFSANGGGMLKVMKWVRWRGNVPCHYVVCYWRGGDACWRVGLHSLWMARVSFMDRGVAEVVAGVVMGL